MLIITGTYKAKSGKREEFLRAILDQGIYDEFLKEEGNISSIIIFHTEMTTMFSFSSVGRAVTLGRLIRLPLIRRGFKI